MTFYDSERLHVPKEYISIYTPFFILIVFRTYALILFVKFLCTAFKV